LKRYFNLLSAATVFICILIFTFLYYHGEHGEKYEVLQSSSFGGGSSIIEVKIDTPFDTIFHFYKAVEANNWELVRALITPALWDYLQKSGFAQKWEQMKKQDPSLRFILFVVKNHSIEEEKGEGEGWVMGKADWTSDFKNASDFTRTIFLKKIEGSWKITRILSIASVETADNFYQAINEGNFERARQLATEAYWDRLRARGVIDALKKEQAAFENGVYVVFYADDFVEKKREAWVSGDVIWKPLTAEEKEIHVDICLIRQNGWKVDKIIGHWEEAK